MVAHEVEGAAAVDIDKVDIKKGIHNLGHFGELVWPGTCDLNAENVFAFVPLARVRKPYTLHCRFFCIFTIKKWTNIFQKKFPKEMFSNSAFELMPIPHSGLVRDTSKLPSRHK